MKYLDEVFRYAMARLDDREEAEDVAIEVVQALPSPCLRRDLRVYMLGMARRKIADRRRGARPTVSVREDEATVRFDVEADEAALVAGVMGELSPDHREVLTLKYVVGLSSSEIGRTLGKRPEAVDSMLQRAREAFARRWNRITSDEVDG
jgi:RNA polymerase sigma-70 factor (ECF subfamily)